MTSPANCFSHSHPHTCLPLSHAPHAHTHAISMTDTTVEIADNSNNSSNRSSTSNNSNNNDNVSDNSALYMEGWLEIESAGKVRAHTSTRAH